MPPYASSLKELIVYQRAMDAAMLIFERTATFPREERFSMTDQIRRSSRSVCANLAEAWRKRRYQRAFVAKLSDCEAEAAEVQVWLELARRSGYITKDEAARLEAYYDEILAMLVSMIAASKNWVLA